PHAGLDQDGRDTLDDLVRAAVAAGATVVLSSHELDRAESLAGRIVDLAGGTTDATPAATGRSRGRRKEQVLVP
ncbi:MAG: daunorubicin/doxorubicin resistance ABC transporter ATP-binding protein DrrA, partial [Actinomycetota bacterium]|nr:daunorubicin/doxorubicin resistance ABC transporter ATP-binding protein DrrA [Actinomycetota bacterium]